MRWDAGAYDAEFGFVTDYGSPLLDLLDLSAPASVLDVGCGTGIHAGAMAARGLEVVGVDLDPHMLERARHEYPGVEFVAADAQTLDLGRRFDAAFSNAALHWMTNQPAALSRIRAHLVLGAALVAEMGGKDNVAIVDAALESAVSELGLEVPPIRKFFPSVAQEAALLEAAGFDVSLMQWFSRPTRLEQGRTAADWTRMFRADVWAEVPSEYADELAVRVDSACSDRLRDERGWFIDYHRLRFVCHAR